MSGLGHMLLPGHLCAQPSLQGERSSHSEQLDVLALSVNQAFMVSTVSFTPGLLYLTAVPGPRVTSPLEAAATV